MVVLFTQNFTLLFNRLPQTPFSAGFRVPLCDRPWTLTNAAVRAASRGAQLMSNTAEQADLKPRNRRERRALAAGRRAYSIETLADETDTGRSKLYEEIRAGRLRAKKLGSRTLITAEAVDDWLAQL